MQVKVLEAPEQFLRTLQILKVYNYLYVSFSTLTFSVLNKGLALITVNTYLLNVNCMLALNTLHKLLDLMLKMIASEVVFIRQSCDSQT